LNWIVLYPIHLHPLAVFDTAFFSSRAEVNPLDRQSVEELIRTQSIDFVLINHNQLQNANWINLPHHHGRLSADGDLALELRRWDRDEIRRR
jgi:hypothetical protein